MTLTKKNSTTEYYKWILYCELFSYLCIKNNQLKAFITILQNKKARTMTSNLKNLFIKLFFFKEQKK